MRHEFAEGVLEFAIDREVEAREFYVKLGAWVERPEVAEMFLKLAQEEAQHKLAMEIEYDWITS